MDDTFLVHILESLANLLHDGCCFPLGKLSLLLDLLQTAIRKGFNNQIQIFLIVEIAEESCQIAMGEVRLDLDLPKDMIFDFQLSNAPFRHLLDDTDEANGFLLSHKDLSKGALT